MKIRRMQRCLYGLLVCLCGCTDPVSDRFDVVVNVYVDAMDAMPGACLRDVQLEVKDLNMGTAEVFAAESTVAALAFSIALPAGYYDMYLTGALVQDSAEHPVSGYLKGVRINANAMLQLDAYIADRAEDFVLAEIFFAGTLTDEGKQYIGDKYVVIYNNSSKTLYADGLLLVESKLKNTQKFELTPDFRSYAFGADAVYRIPGAGTDYPVLPGGHILLVDNAMDHRGANPNSFDLSTADFEWYDQSTNPSVVDVDNPAVTNLEKVYCYTLTIWGPNNQGNTSIALARMPQGLSDEDYLVQYKQEYGYVNVTSAGTFNMTATTYLVPNGWVLDAVNLCPSAAYAWTAVSPRLDAGYTYVAALGSDKTRYGKCVRRKVATVRDGRRVLQDTDNSTNDFLTAQTADPEYFDKE